MLTILHYALNKNGYWLATCGIQTKSLSIRAAHSIPNLGDELCAKGYLVVDSHCTKSLFHESLVSDRFQDPEFIFQPSQNLN